MTLRSKESKSWLPLMALLALACSGTQARAATWAEALEGRWAGPDMTLTIDQGAVMANRDPAKPFDWRAFRIITTTGAMVIFDIGEDRFIGILNGETLTVTRAGHTGSWVLVKDHTDPMLRTSVPPKR